MALRNWHYGKLIILWVWGILLAGFAWYFVVDLEPAGDDSFLPVVGLLSLAFAIGIPAALSVVTWMWLGGKETPKQDG